MLRDMKLYTDNGRPVFTLKLDKNGMPDMMDTEGLTNDQRAAICTVIVMGTIPASEDVGVEWYRQFDPDHQAALLDIDNQCKQMIQDCSTSDGTQQSEYYPMYAPDEDGAITVTTFRGDK